VPDFSFRLRAVGRVAILASRYNELITNRLLEGALACCAEAGLARDAVDVVWVPGAFELPVAAAAAAGTRRYACLVALGAVIRGDTPHFDYVAGETASGVQLAGLETGVPVAFGVLTVETVEQAEARIDKGAEAVRTALEMADVFGQIRAKARA
jgi:6,7-dimethyl-8-ribityllumazine synthase